MEKRERAVEPEYRTIVVRTMDGSTIHGKVNIGANKRVSDLFVNNGENFIVMVDVTLRDGHGKILILNKSHIVWVEPED